jgi:hypothetical protein
VLRDQSRARTFSVVRILQTEAIADKTKEAGAAPAKPGAKSKSKAKDQGKGSEAGSAAASSNDKEAAATAAATDAAEGEGAEAPEKVIGINLPNKHAKAILDEIRGLEGGIAAE